MENQENSSAIIAATENGQRAKRSYHRARKPTARKLPISKGDNSHRLALPWIRPPRKNTAPITPTALRALGNWLCTYDEACSFFGCSTATLAKYMRDYPELRQAWDAGHHEGKLSLRRRQLEIAFGDTPQATRMLIHLGRTILGQSEKHVLAHADQGGGAIRYTAIRRTIVAPRERN
jgi:hypothetical protein